MKKRYLPTAALLLLGSPLAFADRIAKIPTIIVTATRTAQMADETLSQ